jgi:hypothetical protein
MSIGNKIECSTRWLFSTFSLELNEALLMSEEMLNEGACYCLSVRHKDKNLPEERDPEIIGRNCVCQDDRGEVAFAVSKLIIGRNPFSLPDWHISVKSHRAMNLSNRPILGTEREVKRNGDR